MTRMFTTWLPARERERAQAHPLARDARERRVHAAARRAAHRDDRRGAATFEIFGVLGVIWAILLLSLVPRRCRREHPSSTRRSWRCCRRARDTAIAQRACRGALIFSHAGRVAAVGPVHVPGVRLVVLHQLAADVPARRRAARASTMGALLAGLPLLLGGVGCLVSAAVIPRLARTHRQRRRSRAASSRSPASSARRPASSSSRGIAGSDAAR